MSNTAKRTRYCRWGAIETSTEVVPGIRFVSTPSHGGYILSKALNDLVPDFVRSEDRSYEEDCAFCIVVACFPFITTSKWQRDHADTTFKNWYPFEYEAFYNVTLDPSESHQKRKILFHRENRDNWLSRSAFGAWHERVPEGYVGVIASLGEESASFLVPKTEYDSRGEFPFVVNPTKHERVKDF